MLNPLFNKPVFGSGCLHAEMIRSREWLTVVLQALLLSTSSCGPPRRSVSSQVNSQVTKGGWRPVVGSGLLLGSYGSPHAYELPYPIINSYQSTGRPHPTRDTSRSTSLRTVQTYRPTTTIRTVPTLTPVTLSHQPIKTYQYPFGVPQSSITQYKYIQNFPVENIIIKNPHNPYAARPIFPQYTSKFNQPSNLQVGRFEYPTLNVDVFGKPVGYTRPDGYKPNAASTEIFKPEVFEIPDRDSALQSIRQQVKTAQQQTGSNNVPNQFHYGYQNSLPSVFGTFSTYNVQPHPINPLLSPTRATYFPPPSTKQTTYNSFGYTPTLKTTPGVFTVTTPKLQSLANQIHYGSTLGNNKNVPTKPSKLSVPLKGDFNTAGKGNFRASPQDPFNKYHNGDYNKATTYNPVPIHTTTASYFNNYYPSQNYDYYPNVNYEQSKQPYDSVAAGINQQLSQEYAIPPKTNIHTEPTPLKIIPNRATYEVTEHNSEDMATQSSPSPWPQTSEAYNSQAPLEEMTTKQDSSFSLNQATTTTIMPFSEVYSFVQHDDNEYANSLNNPSKPSRQPSGDDFEPVDKHELTNYYYKVSTPPNDDRPLRRKKPIEATKISSTTQKESTLSSTKDSLAVEALPTVPPSSHFKRPNLLDTDKDKIRRRNKNRKRKPIVNNTHVEETSTGFFNNTESLRLTGLEESSTHRSRLRPTKLTPEPNETTPSNTLTTELTTSAIPTIAPTKPIVRKKLLYRRPSSTAGPERFETSTASFNDNISSPIMKITSRPNSEYHNGQPGNSHKHDETKTLSSDVENNTLKTTIDVQDFKFHRDVKPIESKLEPIKTATEIKEDNNIETNNSKTEIISESSNTLIRPRLKSKYERPKFSVKDYRSRLSSTTTEKSIEARPQKRYQQRKPIEDNETETTTERKKFVPKEPRYKTGNVSNDGSGNDQEHSYRQRQRQVTSEANEGTTSKIPTRIRNGQRRTRPTEEPIETSTATTRRILRKKIKDAETGESVQDIALTENLTEQEKRDETTTERAKSESAIMKIADKKHQEHIEPLFEHSKRVSDLTLAASKDYNTPGMFKTISAGSRRIPNYFTIATDDPILPIEAFFPQLNQKKDA